MAGTKLVGLVQIVEEIPGIAILAGLVRVDTSGSLDTSFRSQGYASFSPSDVPVKLQPTLRLAANGKFHIAATACRCSSSTASSMATATT